MPVDAQLPSLVHVLMDEDTESGQRTTGNFKEDNLRQRTGATKLTNDEKSSDGLWLLGSEISISRSKAPRYSPAEKGHLS